MGLLSDFLHAQASLRCGVDPPKESLGFKSSVHDPRMPAPNSGASVENRRAEI